MKALQPYLNFNGTAKDAMTFYQSCLGGQLNIMTMAESGVPVPPGEEYRTMHAQLTSGKAIFMASDTMHGTTVTQGNALHLCIDCDDVAELDRLFAALGAGGTITQPLQDTFWGARFGMLTDKFGVQWMFNCELPKAA